MSESAAYGAEYRAGSRIYRLAGARRVPREDLVQSLFSDLELLDEHGSDALPRSALARAMVAAMRAVHEAAGHTDRDPKVSPRLAGYGAIADHLLAEGAASCAVFEEGVAGADVAADWEALAGRYTPLVGEFLVRAGGAAGAVSGVSGGLPSAGLADAVCVSARNGALAAYASAFIAHSVFVDGAKTTGRAVADPVLGHWQAVGETATLEPDMVWESLSQGVRAASRLKQKGVIGAAALSLKGRGRLVGPVDGDKLLRFGVSEWR